MLGDQALVKPHMKRQKDVWKGVSVWQNILDQWRSLVNPSRKVQIKGPNINIVPVLGSPGLVNELFHMAVFVKEFLDRIPHAHTCKGGVFYQGANPLPRVTIMEFKIMCLSVVHLRYTPCLKLEI